MGPLFKSIFALAAILSIVVGVFSIGTAAAAAPQTSVGTQSQSNTNSTAPQPNSKAAALTSVKVASQKTSATITEAEVNAAQQAWCDALVKIGKIHAQGGDYKALANQAISDLYDYDSGKVFFKPTLAHGPNTFRPTKAGALSYFVGGNPAFPEDTGFALKHWALVRYDNNAAENGIQIHGNIAITMGNVYLTNDKGEQVVVDKTFAFRKCPDGKLRLIVHKSALPFDPAK